MSSRDTKRRGCWWIGTATLFSFAGLILVAVLIFAFTQTTVRSDYPLAGAAAGEATGLSLPPNVSEVYFLTHTGGLQDLEMFATFTVPVDELESCIEHLIAEHNQKSGRLLSYPRQALGTAPVVTPRKEFLPMSWWTPSRITTGYYRGEEGSYRLQFWVDTVRGQVFTYQND